MSRKSSFWIITLFLVVLLTSLLINIPSRQILRFVELPSSIKIKGLGGTLTRGSISVLSYRDFRLSEISFKIQPVCLFKLAICYQLSSEESELTVNIEASLLTQAVSVKQSQILLDSEIFQSIPQLLVKPRGEFVVYIENLSFVDGKVFNLEANADWMGAGIQGEDQLLGNYSALIKSEAEQLSIKLADSDALVMVTGDIAVKWDGQYDVDLNFENRPGLNSSVKNVLEMTTAKTGLNRSRLKKTGVLSAGNQRVLSMFHANE